MLRHSSVVHSCVVHPCFFVPPCALPHCPPCFFVPRCPLSRCPPLFLHAELSTPALSTLAFLPVSRCPLPRFQSPHTVFHKSTSSTTLYTSATNSCQRLIKNDICVMRSAYHSAFLHQSAPEALDPLGI